jgi:hypothetical protein
MTEPTEVFPVLDSPLLSPALTEVVAVPFPRAGPPLPLSSLSHVASGSENLPHDEGLSHLGSLSLSGTRARGGELGRELLCLAE